MTNPKLINLRLEQLTRTIPDAVDVTYTSKGEATIVVDPRIVADVVEFLRRHSLTQYKIMVDMSATDYPSRENRFDVVYLLLSIAYNNRLRVKTLVADGQPIESVRRLFYAAHWMEREIWDLFGIFFSNHPDLRRILTDYGFQGHPFRKDFPLNGYTEARYDEKTKSVRTLPVEITQEFRSFDFERPWEAMTDRS